jgi:hypothetical protein
MAKAAPDALKERSGTSGAVRSSPLPARFDKGRGAAGTIGVGA